MQHRPIREKPRRHRVGDMQPDIEMAIIAADAIIGGANHRAGAFQQLQVNVAPTNQRPGDPIALIALSGLQQDARQRCLVIAKGARGIDDLDKVGNGKGSCAGPVAPKGAPSSGHAHRLR